MREKIRKILFILFILSKKSNIFGFIICVYLRKSVLLCEVRYEARASYQFNFNAAG